MEDELNKRVETLWHFEDSNAQLVEVDHTDGGYFGIEISQNEVTYVARNFFLTQEVKSLIWTAICFDFKKLWVDGHPSAPYLKDEPKFMKGSHHITFARSHKDSWAFVLDGNSASQGGNRQKIKTVCFNKKFENQISNSGVPAQQEGGGGGNFRVTFSDAPRLIAYLDKHYP